MSFLEAVGGLEEGDIGAARSMFTPLISLGLSEGMSSASMLSALREQVGPGLVRTYDFQRLVGEVRQANALAETWAGVPLDSTPGLDAFVEHGGSAFQGYEYRVPVFYRSLGQEEHAPSHIVFAIRSSEPITIEEAMGRAQAHFTEGQQGRYPDQEFLGFGTVGLHHFQR